MSSVFAYTKPPKMLGAIGRAPTGLTSSLAEMKKRLRKVYEKTSDVHKQCEAIIDLPNSETLCWLCGYKVGYINMVHNGGIVQVHKKGEMFDQATCEHVLPIKLAYTLASLYQERGLKEPPINLENLLHTEYEYSHNLCNYAKNDMYFLTWKEYTSGRDFCSLDVSDANIENFLNYLLSYSQEGNTRNSTIKLHFPEGYWPSNPQAFSIDLANLVQANLILEARSRNIDWFADEANQTRVVDEWKYRMKNFIRAKMEGVVQYVMDA